MELNSVKINELELELQLKTPDVRLMDGKSLGCKTSGCKTIKKIEQQLDVGKLSVRPLVVKP